MGRGLDAAISFGVTDSVVVNASIIYIESVSVLGSIVRIDFVTVLVSTVATFGRARSLWFGQELVGPRRSGQGGSRVAVVACFAPRLRVLAPRLAIAR